MKLPRLRYFLIGIVSVAVGITSVTSLMGFEPSGEETPEPEVPPAVLTFALESPSTAAGDVRVVTGQNVRLRFEVTGVKEVLVERSCDGCKTEKFSSRPGNDGFASVEVRLPQAGQTYVLSGVGFVADRLRLAWHGDYYDQRPAVAPAETIRVRVSSP